MCALEVAAQKLCPFEPGYSALILFAPLATSIVHRYARVRTSIEYVCMLMYMFIMLCHVSLYRIPEYYMTLWYMH